MCNAIKVNKTPLLEGVAWSFYILAALAVAFRFIARMILLPGVGKHFWWDDWTMLFAFALLTVYQASLAIRKTPVRLNYDIDVRR